MWFDEVGVGKDAQEAFATAVAAARHTHGAGGYTGTIAEKYDVVFFRPAIVGLSVPEFLHALMDLNDGLDGNVRAQVGTVAWSYLLEVHEETDSKHGPAGSVRLPEEDPRAQKALLDASLGMHAFYMWGWAGY